VDANLIYQTMSLLAGILPFGAAFIELYYVLSSLFASRAYYAFGFVSLTATVFGLTTAMVSILFTYFLLCAEEYRYVFICGFYPLGPTNTV
jgi:transmembrane 9 superfamily protein 2/4